MIVDHLPHELGVEHTALIRRLASKLGEKREKNTLRSSYYAGKRMLQQVSDIVPPQYYNLNLVLGWAAKPVDMLAERVNLESVTWPDGDVTHAIETIFDENDFLTELDSAEVSTLVHGVTYLVNDHGAEGEPHSQIHAIDANHAIGHWNSRTRRLDALLVVHKTEHGTDRILEFTLYLPDETITVEINSEMNTGSIYRRHNPFGIVLAEPLVFKPRVGHPFGYSKITRASMGLTDAAIRALIRLEAHLDIYSYPELYILGADMSIFGVDDGTVADVLKYRMARIKTLPDNEDVEGSNARASLEQISATSPQPHLEALATYAKLFARENNLPDSAFSLDNLANPQSAESYNASQYELVAEAERTARGWSRPVARTIQRALAIQEGLYHVPDEWRSLTCKWRDPRFLSRAAMADAGAKQLATVPWLAETEVGLELLGLNQGQIERALSEKRRADKHLTQLALLNSEGAPEWVPGAADVG